MSRMSTRLNQPSTRPVLNGATGFRKLPSTLFAILSLLILTAAFTLSASAQTIDFESPTYTLGNINGQDGWSRTGPYDHNVSSTTFPGFGAQSLRISNAITSGSFGDMTFSKSLANEAGETSAVSNGMSGGTRKNVFEYEFSIGSAVPGAQQPGLLMSVAPDRGDGARMSYLRFEDQADGIHVFFDGYLDNAPFGGAVGDVVGCGAEDDFTDIDIATLSRNAPHTIKFVMFFYDGPRNDVVQIYIDGVLETTGTSWEDYFRYCEGNQTRTVDSLLFRTAGTAVPANSGKGFLIDNASSASSTPSGTTVAVDDDGMASPTDCNAATPALTSIGSAVVAANPGDTIRVCSGTYNVGSQIAITKANLTIVGVGATKPVVEVPFLGAGVHNIAVNAAGVTLDNLEIKKTDLGSIHNIILVQGNSFTAKNNLIYGPNPGGTWSATGLVSRAFEITGGLTGLLLDNNIIHTLRQPAYINGGASPNCTTGTISNNNVSATRGWVVDGASLTFTGNTFGPPANQGADIAFLSRCTNADYNNTLAISQANDGAVISAQFPGGVSGSALVYVDDSAAPGGIGTIDAPFQTITQGINGVIPGGTVNVAAGVYNEHVDLNKANTTVTGAGIDVSIIKGPKNHPDANTVFLSQNGSTLQGFTITRDGNNAADWNSNTQSQGVSFGQLTTGITLQNNKVTGNRNGVYINNSQGNIVRRNIIDFNRTGIQTANNINNTVIEENFITNNWTLGLLFNFDSPGTFTTTGISVRNNHFSGNWYAEVANRGVNSTVILNLSGNWFGTTNVTTTTAGSAEPGYAAQIPVEYGGSSTPPGPGVHFVIGGAESAKLDYSPWLNTGVDTDLVTPGFQGDFSNLNVSAASPQATAGLSNIQEAINLATSGATLNIAAGTYAGNVNVNKPLTITGAFTVSGTFTTSVSGVTVAPGSSPGIINTGNLSFTAGTNVNIELNGTTPGTGYDQFNVTGTVSLGNANLIVSNGFTPAIGNTFTIINNDGADAVTGTFNGLAENTVFFVGSNSYRISYVGGTGNDVVLTTVSLCNTVSIPTNLTSTVATPANTINVPVNVDDVTGHGLYSFDFTVNYDPAVITSPVVSATAMTSSTVLTVNNPTPGVLIISGFQSGSPSVPPLAGSGALVNINFTVVGGIGSSSGINFSSFMFNEGTPCLSTSNGLLTVVSGTVSGTINYLNSLAFRPVPGAVVTANGAVIKTDTTDLNGDYDISNLGNSAYTLTPSKSGDLQSSITGQDATRIAQHVVNISPFPVGGGAFRSADVSGNGTITSFDASMVARFVVNLPDTGVTGTWKFTPVSRPVSLAEVQSGLADQDFSAILMGDVTGNWGGPQNPTRQTVREEDLIRIDAPKMSVESGSEFVIPVQIGNLNRKDITSYQFELAFSSKAIHPAANPCDLLGTVSKDLFVTCNADTAGLLKVVVFGIKSVDGNGTLLNLRFTTVGSAGSITPLTFKTLMLNEGEPLIRAADGEIQIVAPSDDTDSLRGQVLSATGEAVAGTQVQIAASNGKTRTVYTNDSGYFNFDKVVVGETYVISVISKGHKFTPQTVSAGEGVTQLTLIAEQ